MKTIRQITLAFLLLTASFLVGWSLRPKCPTVSILERVDTVFVRDTIRDTVRIPQTRYVVRIDTVRLQVAGDTVYIDAQIPIERKEYQTDDYKAVIEGWRPELIAMEVYRQTWFIDRVQTVSVPDRRRWGLGIQAGYGASIRGGKIVGVPYIGIGAQYNLIIW